MPLEESVKRSLLDAAEREDVPHEVAHRLEVLASALADGEVDPVNWSEMDRRLELLLRGFDFQALQGRVRVL